MKENFKNTFRVFLTAYVQVFLLVAQTKFIVNDHALLVGFMSMGISTCWLFNVNGVIKTVWHKIGYVLGCTFGSATSMYVIDLVLKFIS